MGRTVGAYLQYQKNQGKPESLRLEGSLDDGNPATPDSVSLKFERAEDGRVKVNGSYAGEAVDISIDKVVRPPLREKDNLIFGQAGTASERSMARLQGHIGSYPVAAQVTTYRQEVDIEMTPELAEAGKTVYVMPFALSVTPTFGGAPARVNGLPGDAPTASRPLQTTDRTTIEADCAGHHLLREQNWTTTTWTVSTNLREGGSRIEMKQREAANETEAFDGQRTQRSFEVASGKSAQSDDRSYHLDFAKGVVSGRLTNEQQQLSFSLYAG
ncbi:MAG: hypothetical protein AB7S38_22640 [Vulcanimicrobiota bacterium]